MQFINLILQLYLYEFLNLKGKKKTNFVFQDNQNNQADCRKIMFNLPEGKKINTTNKFILVNNNKNRIMLIIKISNVKKREKNDEFQERS